MKSTSVALLCGVILAALPGCKIVKTAAPGETAADSDEAKIASVVADTYDARLVPLIARDGADAATVLTGIAEGLDAAGAAHGHRAGGEGGSWVFAVKGAGTVTGGDRKSRAAKLEVDVTGDGKADLVLQLGPVVKGTALRDVAPFYDFTAFRDQIQFAMLGRALNDRATGALKLPEGDLVGRRVAFAGAFAVRAKGDPVLVTPVSVEVAP